LTGLLPRCVLALLIGFAGAGLTQPAFAREPHAQHARSAASKSSPDKGAKTGLHAPAAAGTGSKSDVDSPAGEAPIGKSANKPPDANAGFKPKVRQIPHGAPVTGPSSTVTRNAIGVPVLTHQISPGSGGVHSESAPAGAAIAPGPGPVSLPSGHPTPVANAGLAASGRIGGTGLIRPAQAPSGLGGPAKPAAGINGTTLRPRP
jgi:hypothetical protein